MTIAHSGIAAFYIVQVQQSIIFTATNMDTGRIKMAHIAENISTGARTSLFVTVVGRLRATFARRRVYNRTYAELSALTTRELDDLGISRSMISRLAQEAASKN